MIPSHKVIGIYEETALSHVGMLDPFLGERVGELDILQTEERTVLEEE